MQKSYLPGELIREIRKRKGLRQSSLTGLDSGAFDSQVTLSRIENLKQNPSRITLIDLLSKVELPYGQFFCPHMEDQPAESFALRHQIYYLLDRAQGDERTHALTQDLLERLKCSLDFDSLINRQLWLSLKTELDVLRGAGDTQTRDMILEGIRITYPEFEAQDFNGDVLILREGDLLVNLARCYANMGDLDFALSILTHIKAGYAKQPLGEMHKEAMLSRIQILMVQLLLDKGDYPAALAASDEAMTAAKKQSGSSILPEAVHLRGLALFHATGDKGQSAALLRQAYFAFSLLKKSTMQARVLQDAQEYMGVELATYHTECITSALPRDFFRFRTGGALAVDNLGALLRQFRLSAGAKQSEVYAGICSRSFYSRIEAGKRTGVGIFILEALMQRLGRDIDLYMEYFSSIDEWEEGRLRMRYLRELYIGNTDEAQETLNRLLTYGDFTQGLGKQFLLFAKAMMMYMRGEQDGYLALLCEAIKITIPAFREDAIAGTRLTYHECNLINAMANYYAEHGQVQRGIAIYLGIRDSMNRFYVDDSIKARYYLTLLNNLALEHYNIGQYEKALEFVNESENICQRHGVLFVMNETAHRKALCLHKLGRRDEAIAYTAMAYYSGSLTGSADDVNSLAAFAWEELGISFSRDGGPGFLFYREKAGTYADPPQKD